jgi:hypothetical protein
MTILRILCVATAAALLAFSAAAQMNPLEKQSTSKDAVCPLSDAQVQKSIEAFAKLVPTLTREPRCLNCHGGVDPFSDEAKGDSTDPNAPRTAHGPGKVEADECMNCHSDMPPKRDGSPSKWALATPEHSFLGKDAKALCKQMRDVFKQGADFIGHLTDDNGNSNFTGTAFLGNRGLNDQGQSHVDKYKPEPPRGMTQGGLISLGNDWIAATGGEFKGDVDCGCEPMHYSLRISSQTDTHFGIVNGHHAMTPVEVPITFHDNGTFTGEQVQASFQGNATAAMCQGQYASSMVLKVSGDATEEWNKNFMNIKVEKASPTTSNFAGQCPHASAANTATEPTPAAVSLSLTGKVRETLDYFMPSPPGVTTKIHTEIVKRD